MRDTRERFPFGGRKPRFYFDLLVLRSIASTKVMDVNVRMFLPSVLDAYRASYVEFSYVFLPRRKKSKNNTNAEREREREGKSDRQ